jgi:hypothetical protein
VPPDRCAGKLGADLGLCADFATAPTITRSKVSSSGTESGDFDMTETSAGAAAGADSKTDAEVGAGHGNETVAILDAGAANFVLFLFCRVQHRAIA